MDELNGDRMEESNDEGELSDDDSECLSFDELLDWVESNDPSLTKLEVPLRTIVLPNNNDHRYLERLGRLERLSTAICGNTHLTALMFGGYSAQLDEAQAVNIFRGIACNQSTKRFAFNNCGEYLGNACRILTPLFKRNQVERIGIGNCNMSTGGIGLLSTSLAEFDSLKEFALIVVGIQHNPESDHAMRELIQSLSRHSGLRELGLSCTDVGKLCCPALVDLLSNPNTILKVLDLFGTRLGDVEAVALSSGMAGNISLNEIDLGCNRDITQAGWQAIFESLSNSRCRLEKIKLDNNEISAAAAQSLLNALYKNTATLRILNLRCTSSITIAGWRILFDFLRSQTCVLEDLDLSDNQLNDEVITYLTDALASDRSLKGLDLFSNTGVTGTGWQRFFSTVLANPSSELEKLNLGECDINDAAIRALTNALVINSKLKVLNLSGNNQVTNEAWQTFSSVLESPHTALEEIDLDEWNKKDDATLTSLMNSLANNKKLKKMIFDHSQDWEPPLSVLCNAASIMGTYNSNHSLQKVGHEDDKYFPGEFELLLQINRENSPSQAAQLKIIDKHFNGGFIAQPFIGMDLNVLPHAMAWMSRDGEVNGHFYGFIRSMASLFEKGNTEEE